MKKFFLAAMCIATAMAANAEGYQVNTLSAKQGGMGHTGVALDLGAESMFFNPAGMTSIDGVADFSVSANTLFSYVKADVDGTWYKTDNKVKTPLFATAGFSITDRIKAGLAFYTPYGSGIDWGTHWPGAILNERVDLTLFTVQPTVAWQPIDGLSIGAGLVAAWGNVDLDKGMISSTSMEQAFGVQLHGLTPAWANLKGNSRLAWGYNVGVKYDFNKNVSIGASYRSKTTAKVKEGTAKLSYANETLQAVLSPILGPIDNGSFNAQMPMPAVLTFGGKYKPISALTLAVDFQLSFWSAYKTLEIGFNNPQLDAAYRQSLKKDYKDAWAFRFGAQYNLTDRVDLRAGICYDMTPVNFKHYNPETPGMGKLEPSVGVSYRIWDGLSFNFAALYVAGLGANNAICDWEDSIFKVEREFKADYRITAFNLAFGLSYKF